MQTLNKLPKNYKTISAFYQIKLPLDIEIKIPADDPVRLLSAYIEGMNLSALYETYGKVRENQATPRQMLKIVVYAAMNRIYSSRDIEKACQRDINFMYLLNGKPAPDHSTVARFISMHFSLCSKEILAEVSNILFAMGEISGEAVFIDGTKIEAYANRYTFVWKKAVTKNMTKLIDKITSFVAECESAFGMKIVYNDLISENTLKRLKKELCRIKEEEGIEFVYGPGKRKTGLQRAFETLEDLNNRLKEYKKRLDLCGERNSYSKTDVDATFMRMKEDHMRNGQLKPAYNLQHGVDSEYITWLDISSSPTDTNTLIPFLKDMDDHLGFRYRDIVADAGYESEENYLFIEKNGQTAYIKPGNYEISKKRKYRNDIGRQENMFYDREKDEFTCAKNKKLIATGERTRKTVSGYVRTSTIYTCSDCAGCSLKKDCIHGNNCKTPFEERFKQLEVSKVMRQKRAEDLERITSDYGIQLRMNRSIQAEGSFAEIKEDMNFRRYLYRGKKNVLAQSTLLAIARNINKLHNKIQNGKTKTHLFSLNESA